MQKKFSPVLIIIFLLLIFAGCESKKKKEKEPVISEGIVKYKITYDQEMNDQPFSFLLPDEMEYFFRPGQERISFQGNMGLYVLDFISNHNTDSSTTLLKIFSNKMYVPKSESRKLFIFNALREGEVEFDEDTTRTILGYEARKAHIRLDSQEKTSIEVWYTPEITMDSTNKNTPFAEIPGVMLEFAIYYNDVLFSLKSESVEKAEHDDSVFDIPDDYKVTTLNDIEKMIATIVD
ncbi:MAG: hypothetical protein R6U46_03510 [Marinilabilia sp.]